MNPLTEAEIVRIRKKCSPVSSRIPRHEDVLRLIATIEHLQAELAGRKLDVEAANEECERQTELAKLSVRRMCEMAEPGWIGAFAARDHAVAELARVTGERDQQKRRIQSHKAFHASLCSRFGYSHDEIDWERDFVSLEEFIAAQLAAAEQKGRRRRANEQTDK